MEEDLGLMVHKKAVLLTSGAVQVSPSFRAPFPLSRSTAGPGAGSTAVVLSFDRFRVKKAITTGEAEFRLVGEGPSYTLMRNEEMFLQDVRIVPTLAHAPEQAFFNLETRCIYHCRFCTSPVIDERLRKGLEPDKVVEMVRDLSRRQDLRAVAFTAAVSEDPQTTVEKLAYVIARVREMLPDMTIGVEPYIDRPEQIEQLKRAGADEIKLNLETYDADIFQKVCGELDLGNILRHIEHAVEVFGRGKVTSNIIVGMGESDDNVLEGVEALARRGCIATLRPLRLNALNRGPMTAALGPLEEVTPERLLRLAGEHRRILEEHGLTTLMLHSMCHECGCCDIVPFRDL